MRVLIFMLSTIVVCEAQIASGGPFSLSKSAVGGGGNTSSNASFTVEGTVAQSAAGGPLQAGPFSVYSGFWTPAPLAPTAAHVGISGRILTATGQGIRSAYVTLTGADGVPRTALSSSLGYYSFSEVDIGDTYILTVSSKRYVFPEPTIVIHVVDQLDDLDFIAAP